ncbi:MAG: protease inhibitor I42 family protein [Chloroflexi bacterium]|nr:protease inhibitor I42 family protein [Chloroflexota bacterium]
MTDQDQGQTVEVGEGGMLVVELPGNATTGYTWGILVNDSAVLQPVGGWTYQAKSDAAGAPGTFTFQFRGGAPGTSALKLGYKQWWDAAMTPDPVFEVTVNVKQVLTVRCHDEGGHGYGQSAVAESRGGKPPRFLVAQSQTTIMHTQAGQLTFAPDSTILKMGRYIGLGRPTGWS